MTSNTLPLEPMSKAWFENMLRMVELEGRGIPGLTAEQAMAQLDPYLDAIDAQPVVSAEMVEHLSDMEMDGDTLVQRVSTDVFHPVAYSVDPNYAPYLMAAITTALTQGMEADND